jgi:hypothetical protein
MAMRQLGVNRCFLRQHAFFLGSMAYPTGHAYVDAKVVFPQLAIYLCASVK